MSRFNKKTATLIVLSLLAITATCTPSDSAQTLDVSLGKGQLYEYPTVAGDEEGARIAVQPGHSAISEIRRSAATNWVAVYVYQPAADFVGFDYAELEILTGSSGASPRAAQKVAIRFVVGN